MKLKTNYLYLLFIPLIALGFYRIYNPPSQDDKKMPKQTETEVQTTEEVQTISEEVPTISLDSIKKLGIDITLWAESPEDFEKIHMVKLERYKYIPIIYFQTKEKIEFPSNIWFQPKEGKEKLALLLYSWNEGNNHLEYLLKNKDKKFVVIGCYNDK